MGTQPSDGPHQTATTKTSNARGLVITLVAVAAIILALILVLST